MGQRNYNRWAKLETKYLSMINITHKSNSYREATAQAVVKFGSEQTGLAIKNNSVPKGNVLEMAKTAGLFAVKNTSNAIPDCHPLPIEYTNIRFELESTHVKIFVEVATIYKTGVEVEAMHGATIVALTMYDMLKPIDKEIVIEQIKLVNKVGGKSSFVNPFSPSLKAAVIVCSDSISAGKKSDQSGKNIIQVLEKNGIEVAEYAIIPDDAEAIANKAKQFAHCHMVIFTGGTGLSATDTTPEALLPLIDKRIDGIEEAIRSYGQQRMPYAMLSRSVAGLMGNTLLLALPGSSRGATESMQAIFPAVTHLFKILQHNQH